MELAIHERFNAFASAFIRVHPRSNRKSLPAGCGL